MNNNITLVAMDKFTKESSKINLKGKRIPKPSDVSQAIGCLSEIIENLQNLVDLAQKHKMKMTDVAYIDKYGHTTTYNSELGALENFSLINPFDTNGNRTHDNFGNKIQTKTIEINGEKHLLDFTDHYCYVN